VPISHLQISQGHDGLGKAKIQMSDFKMVHLLQKNESQGHDGLGKPKFLNSDEKDEKMLLWVTKIGFLPYHGLS